MEDLYWKKNLTTQEMAKKFGIKHGRTVLKKLVKNGIKTKTVSQALTKKFKAPFSGNLEEKSFLLGLRAGDFHAKRVKLCVRVQTTTTHPAQVELTKNSFSKYGDICVYFSKNKAREDEWFVYTDLHPSFDFLLEKPETIPDWILNDKKLFYLFLAAYADCEGTWAILKSHKKHLRVVFRIRSQDKTVLKQLRDTLASQGFYALFYLSARKGTVRRPFGSYSKDMFELTLYRKNEVVRLVNELFRLSKHEEKISKMKLIKSYHSKKWVEVKPELERIRKEIKAGLLKSKPSAYHTGKQQRNDRH